MLPRPSHLRCCYYDVIKPCLRLKSKLHLIFQSFAGAPFSQQCVSNSNCNERLTFFHNFGNVDIMADRGSFEFPSFEAFRAADAALCNVRASSGVMSCGRSRKVVSRNMMIALQTPPR
ncbi:hypothetical protein KCU65_g288, partial [Aureobasidium melanogenum]